jgi:hypothetical protein
VVRAVYRCFGPAGSATPYPVGSSTGPCPLEPTRMSSAPRPPFTRGSIANFIFFGRVPHLMHIYIIIQVNCNLCVHEYTCIELKTSSVRLCELNLPVPSQSQRCQHSTFSRPLESRLSDLQIAGPNVLKPKRVRNGIFHFGGKIDGFDCHSAL